jgi:hypothetical protein
MQDVIKGDILARFYLNCLNIKVVRNIKDGLSKKFMFFSPGKVNIHINVVSCVIVAVPSSRHA